MYMLACPHLCVRVTYCIRESIQELLKSLIDSFALVRIDWFLHWAEPEMMHEVQSFMGRRPMMFTWSKLKWDLVKQGL